MNDETLQDLKQFIAATVSQQTQLIKDEIVTEIDSKIDNLDKKIDNLDKKIDNRTDEILVAVGESTETRFDIIEEDVKDLQTRVARLESTPA